MFDFLLGKVFKQESNGLFQNTRIGRNSRKSSPKPKSISDQESHRPRGASKMPPIIQRSDLKPVITENLRDTSGFRSCEKSRRRVKSSSFHSSSLNRKVRLITQSSNINEINADINLSSDGDNEELLSKINKYSGARMNFTNLSQVIQQEYNGIPIFKKTLEHHSKEIMKEINFPLEFVSTKKTFKLSITSYKIIRIHCYDKMMPLVVNFKQRTKNSLPPATYIVYYSSMDSRLDHESYELKWTNPQVIKLYDDTSKDSYFQHEIVYLRIEVWAECDMNIHLRYSELGHNKFKSWKERKDMDVFAQFKQRFEGNLKNPALSKGNILFS